MVRRRIYVGLIVTLAATAQIFAGFMSSTQGYNLISFDNSTLTNSDVEGKVAVGGAVNSIQSYSIGEKAVKSAYSLVSNGNLTYIGGKVMNGGIYSAGSADIINVNPIEGDVVKNGGAGVNNIFNFNSVKTELNTVSANYASHAQTGTMKNENGNLTFYGNSDVNYFTINGSDLTKNFYNLDFKTKTNSVSIISIIGDVATSNLSLNAYGSLSDSKTLFNFTGTDAFTISGSLNGSLLATKCDLNLINGQINGQIVANKITGQSQFNAKLFNFDEPSDVPEGSVTILMITGLIVLVAVASRKRFSVSKN